jgi:hypothetical protein
MAYSVESCRAKFCDADNPFALAACAGRDNEDP